MIDRKRLGPLSFLAARSRRFWIIVLLMVPICYVLGFGPLCWFHGKKRADAPPAWTDWMGAAYIPLGQLAVSQLSIGRPLRSYAAVEVRRGRYRYEVPVGWRKWQAGIL